MSRRNLLEHAAIFVALIASSGSVATAAAKSLGAGDRYVAMGSSFAAGSGIAPYDETAPARCQRSKDNYAHQLARKRGLTLVDVSCGGATTAHILGPWGELTAQIDAVTSDTALVTVTIGGNDLGYIGGLIFNSCDDPGSSGSDQPMCRMIAANRGSRAGLPTATGAAWQNVEASLTQIARELRRRAPGARVVFVDYLTVLPQRRLCRQTPVPPAAAASARRIAVRLSRLTAEVALRNGAEVLRASVLSRRHHACSPAPWMYGFIPPQGNASFTPYHPNQAGMTAIATALDRRLRR